MNLNNVSLIFLSLFLISLHNEATEYPIVRFGGIIMLDYDKFDTNFVGAGNTDESRLEIRRILLGLSSDLAKDWSGKFVVNIYNDIKVKDAYIKYKRWDIANITIGNQREPFGLERLMSGKDTLMIERSIVTTAITPNRTHGINLTGNDGSLDWALGYFQKDNPEKGNSVTGRLSWTPWREDRNLVHVGIAFSERSLHGASFRIKQRMEVHGADSFVNGIKIEAETASLTGLEFLWQNNGFVNLAEWQKTKVTSIDGSEFDYQGGYYQLSYMLSGKNRKYKNGILGGIDSHKDWEATMRFSQLKLVEENSQTKIFSIGLNYSLNNNLKFMANLINARYVSEGEHSDSGNAISLRAQTRF